MCPDRLHERLEADVLKVVVDDKSEVFVDGEDSNGIQVGQYAGKDLLIALPVVGVVIECLGILRLELICRHEHHRCVQLCQYPFVPALQQLRDREGFTQVGSHGDTRIDLVRFVNKHAVLLRVTHGECHCTSAEPDGQPQLLVGYVMVGLCHCRCHIAFYHLQTYAFFSDYVCFPVDKYHLTGYYRVLEGG